MYVRIDYTLCFIGKLFFRFCIAKIENKSYLFAILKQLENGLEKNVLSVIFFTKRTVYQEKFVHLR